MEILVSGGTPTVRKKSASHYSCEADFFSKTLLLLFSRRRKKIDA